jgi:D-sedoheptulose 7-phosphate isomerase
MGMNAPNQDLEHTLPGDHYREAIQQYLVAVSQAIAAIPVEAIWQTAQVLFRAWQNKKAVYICGNGGSATTAIHMANDFVKFTCVDGKPRMRAVALTSNIALLTAWANDEDYDHIFLRQLESFLEPEDVLVGISASGNSVNVLLAAQYAEEHGGISIGLTGKSGGKLKQITRYCLCIPDENIPRAEDGHLVIDHILSSMLRKMIETSA